MTGRGRWILATLVAIGLALAAAGVVRAYFGASTSAGSAGQARASSVGQASAPAPAVSPGASVTVSWGASALANGVPADGYVVTRYDAATGAPQTTGPGCSGTITATSCTELAVPYGTWTYTVTARKGAYWLGAASVQSGAVTIGPSTLVLTRTTFNLADFGIGGSSATLSGTLSGFAAGESISYRLDGVTGTVLAGTPSRADGSGNATVSITLPRTGDGPHTIYAVGSGSVASEPIVIDTVSPTSSASGADAVWHASPVTVTLSATDPVPATGVAQIAYQVDSGLAQTVAGGHGSLTVAAPADHSNDGSHTLAFHATDSAGNDESPAKTVQVKIDTTPPSTSDDTASLGSGWFNAARTVTLTPTDAGSGVAATYSTTDGTMPTTASNQGTSIALSHDGIYTVKYFSGDNAGNQEPARTASTQIHIDTTAPAPATTSLTGAYTSGGVTYVANGVLLQNAATDPTVDGASSGVASVAYYVCAGTCTPSPGAAGTTLIGTSTGGPAYSFPWSSQPADGVYSVLARVTDAAGNSADAAVARLRVDNTPPTTTDNTASIGSGWFNAAKTVTLTPADAGSGVAATYSTTDGTTPTSGSRQSTSATLATDGVYTLRYFSVDNLANAETVKTAVTQIHIDRTAPTPAATTVGGGNSYTSGGTTYVRNGVVLQNTATDATVNGASSGVASVAYYACAGSCTPSPGGAGTTLIGTSTAGPSYAATWSSQPADGLYSILARVTDNAGNTADSAVTTLRIDNTAPITTDDTTSLGSGWLNAAKTVTLTPTDGSGSGVAATYATTDGSTPTTASPQGATVTLVGDGVYTVTYFSVDNLGNSEPIRTAATQIHIDRTAPAPAGLTTSGAYTGAGVTWIKNGTVLEDAATDATVNGASSGVASVAYYACAGSCTPSPGGAGTTLIGTSTAGPNYAATWSSQPADGLYNILARVTDNAGNTADSAVIQRTPDNTGPTIGTTLADATVNQAGYINGGGSFYAYANVADAGSGVNGGTIRADLSGQCAGCSSVTLSASGGPFTLSTAAGTVTYAYRSPLQTAVAAPTTSYSATAADNLANQTTQAGSVTIDGAGKPGAPAAVTLASGYNATSYSACTLTANGYINAAHQNSETVTVTTASNSPANGVVKLTISGGTTLTYFRVVPAAGTQTLTFAGLDLSGLNDGTVTLSAVEYTPGGNSVTGAKSQNVAKLTVPTAPSITAITYTDNTGTTADQVTGANGAGPANGFLAFLQTLGTHLNAVFYSGQLGAGGNFAKLNLAAETTTPTYAITAVDAACNLSTAVGWSPTDTK